MNFFCFALISILLFHSSCNDYLLSSNQKLEVVSVKWKFSLEPLTVQDSSNLPNNFGLTNEDAANLKSLGLTGQIAFAGSSGVVSLDNSEGKPARVLIVMQHQLKESIKLKQPNGVDLIYVQNEDGWKMYPSNAPTLERTIHLWADEKNPTWATRYSIERPDNTLQGGTLFTW